MIQKHTTMEETMKISRREALKAGGGMGLFALFVGFGLIKPGTAFAQTWNKEAFATKNLAEAFKSLGVAAPTMTGDISITAPEIAENGAVVPISAVSRIPNTQMMAYLIENNPNTVTAIFEFPEGTLAEVQTRVKMGKTSNVMVLVKAGDKVFAAQKEVKVTIGGCGG
jgi:sulfur-oxidizing protein SoxY